jgi:hypothetical protein
VKGFAAAVIMGLLIGGFFSGLYSLIAHFIIY